MKLFFPFRNYLQNSQNILFSFPSNLSHLYLSFHASWSLRFLLVGGGVSDAVLISLSSDDCFPVLFLKCLPLGFFVWFKAFSTFWYDPKKKNTRISQRVITLLIQRTSGEENYSFWTNGWALSLTTDLVTSFWTFPSIHMIFKKLCSFHLIKENKTNKH